MGKYAILTWVLLAVLLGACGSDSEPTALQLEFDGENCVYSGPAEVEQGPITFTYLNNSENWAYVNLLRHTGDQTIQDAIDHIGEEPSQQRTPGWSDEYEGLASSVAPGTYTWEGDLLPGTHHMICANRNPLGVYFGGGFEVTD